MLNISILLIFLAFPFYCFADDLLGARCQSRCLFKLETKLKDNAELRRQLKHQIVNLCKDDAECSSCVLPCRETTTISENNNNNNLTCFGEGGICSDAKDKKSCQESCQFFVNGFKLRPGECPTDIPVRLDECSAACNRDGDCPGGADKCCTTGCSRLCVAPIKFDKRIMPIPEGISVQERKRKRSAVVRWIMKRLSKAHMSTNANLYVIQWRWGVRKDSESMTPWQTIMVKNKMYAILKHLLMPGRYYIFRVAAVNQFGSTGFSLPSAPFKLSKEVKAPSSPKNLTVESMIFDDTVNRWIPKLTWIPPTSDLPIKDYQLSWWKSSMEFANAYEQRTGKQIPDASAAAQQGRRSTATAAGDDEDYSNIDESIEKSLRSSTIIPSYATKTQLSDGLDAERVYMVELFATVDSTEGELRGEPAVIFVRTTTKSLLNDAESVRYEVQPPPPESSSQNDELTTTTATVPSTIIFTTINPKLILAKDIEIFTTEDEDDEGFEGRNELDIRTPYFEASQLRTSVSWLDSPACSPETSVFAVRLTPKRCSTQSDTRLLTVTQCIALIDGLAFDCEYEIEVDDVNARKVVSRAFFQTFPCDRTPATDALNCNYTEPTQPRCRIIQPSTAICEWPTPTDPSIIGYRTILSSPQSSAKIGVASTHSPRIQYDNLLSNTDYRFRLQPVTNKGLSSPIDVEFSTTKSSSSEVGSERRLDKFPILELPLESNSISLIYSNFMFLTGFLFLRIFVH